jgi:hypothetical protein
MAISYTNRIGKTYYLLQGKTKTGKPRYFFSTKSSGKGEPVKQIPEGYEIYEHPQNAQVFLRKKRPKLITDSEKQLVETAANALERSKRYRVEIKDEYITIYESNVDIGNVKNILGDFLKDSSPRPGLTKEEAMNTLLSVADQYYTAMMRFKLIDKETRTFTAERFCFQGSIDDWILLGGPDDLKTLVNRYVKILGTDKLFNAPYF